VKYVDYVVFPLAMAALTSAAATAHEAGIVTSTAAGVAIGLLAAFLFAISEDEWTNNSDSDVT